MPPGLAVSELTATPPQYMQLAMDESSLFPPISRKSDLSLGSETDSSDYFSQTERKSHTRSSVTASLSSSPLKFPTIDHANPTSFSSLPCSRSTRHRSMTRELRSSYCRSPSCPSNLSVKRDCSNVNTNISSRKENRCDSETRSDEKGSVLPNIFSKDSSPRADKSTWRREKQKDISTTLTLRRTDSFIHPIKSDRATEPSAPLTNRDVEQRQGQAAALLLPIRNTTQTNKKKKKRRSRIVADQETDFQENTPRNFDSDCIKSQMRYSHKTEDALDVIARENEHYDDTELETPRAIEINSSRKVKQWINGNPHSHSESEIKV